MSTVFLKKIAGNRESWWEMKNLNEIKGIGPKTLEILSKLNINSTKDLITYFPFKYNIIKRTELVDGDVIIDGVISSTANIFFFGKNKSKLSFRIENEFNIININILNRHFIKDKIIPGNKITIIGKFDSKFNSITASELKFYAIGSKTVIEPVYHVTSGITSPKLQTYIFESLKENEKIDSLIPKYLEEKYNLYDYNTSLRLSHFPRSEKDIINVSNRIKYEELFMFMLKINYLKKQKDKDKGIARVIDENHIDSFTQKLPFKLTLDQSETIRMIKDDMESPIRMNRLVQGDVGSGKTIVAFASIYFNYLSGYQSALMAPTEVLARQHYINFKKLFPEIEVVYLSGKTKTSDRKIILELIESGEAKIIIGTHALFSNDVIYNNLGLIITDEQHRFGVSQRNKIKEKGIKPDILYMSATPIPRTYALTIYGDMDVSSIRTMPSGRKQVVTTLHDDTKIKDVLNKMLTELKKGHQIYVISPLIDESDELDLESVNELNEKLNKAFGKYYKIGMMHGALSSKKKEEVMKNFKQGNLDILISTTVIEVGVDVANATMMVIFDAYRFGLSQLHQLRGRVGRNNLDSYCLLISNKETERLKILTKINDGFEISEADFKLRGSGDLFGTKQSGDMVFKMANLKNDFNILKRAKEDSLELLNSKEFINGEYPELKKIIQKSLNQS